VWVFAGGVYPHDEVSAERVAPDWTGPDGRRARADIAGVRSSTSPHREKAYADGPPDRRACRLCTRSSAISRAARPPWATDRALRPGPAARIPT